MRKTLIVGMTSLIAVIPTLAWAQDAAPLATGALQIASDDTLNSGDNSWILISAALVWLMAMPGLALFYGGLVRAKSFLSVLVQIGAIVALASVLWVMVGYSLAFGEGRSIWLGGLDMAMLSNTQGLLHDDYNISERTFALFQMTFAAITPALMVGAWVDRVRFGWVLGFCALWGLLVYVPVAHAIWGGGWLASLGTLDFAGGIVVHTTAGVSALLAALLIGKRQGFPRSLVLPHSPSLTMAGAALLWVGWFGFNGGSALSASDDAASAIINTQMAACVAALVWMLIERIMIGKPTSIGFATGAVAGLATITPAAGYVAPGAAMALGAIAALVCYPMILLIKQRLSIDDSLDVFAVHGVGGMTGSLLLAPLMLPQLGGIGFASGHNLLSQLAAQAIGVFLVLVWSVLGTLLAAVLVSIVYPPRVSEDDEREGLDLTSHGERAWEFE